VDNNLAYYGLKLIVKSNGFNNFHFNGKMQLYAIQVLVYRGQL
jgi:hypothetical protein